ncbi:hypothetical protein TorRG33x02_309720 [Trema orientale]|uniref:Galactose oxidase/kelch, beta-propeller n=1 Tax=Trema orientale TaxID=63057 RepID=A0A2P5BTC6_TREOI|nr:hypothetical protein TorRG33x02_309720 [Trema orientale]
MRFRVVLISAAGSIIFCSETREWKTPENPLPYPGSTIVANNGILYWIVGSSLTKIGAFDPFKGIYFPLIKHISFPAQFRRGRPVHIFRVNLGVVRGKLRLSKFCRAKKNGLRLRIRELDINFKDVGDPGTWSLIHDVIVEKRRSYWAVGVISFHPNNGNVVFCYVILIFGDLRLEQTKMRKLTNFQETTQSLQILIACS